VQSTLTDQLQWKPLSQDQKKRPQEAEVFSLPSSKKKPAFNDGIADHSSQDKESSGRASVE
jgi:hypothetical protein